MFLGRQQACNEASTLSTDAKCSSPITNAVIRIDVWNEVRPAYKTRPCELQNLGNKEDLLDFRIFDMAGLLLRAGE